jgi:recombination protein RecA
MPKTPSYSLETAMADIDKEYGTGAIFRMGEDPDFGIDCVSTGILPLDIALGKRGGLPLGRFTEIYGPQGSGKTTIVLSAIALAQAKGNTCAFIDAEHAIDPTYAAAIGVNVDELLIAQPDTGEEAFTAIEKLARTGEVSIIGVDSVAALLPRSMIEGNYGEAFVGMHPKFMSQSLGKLKGVASGGSTAIVFINQLRESIGKQFGSPEYTPGGKALGYYSSVRLDVRRIETLKDSDGAFANRTRVKVVKNKVGIPYKMCEFDLEYGVGIPREGCLIDLGITYGLVIQNGSWFATADGEKLGQGRSNAMHALFENTQLATELEGNIREAAFGEGS